VAFRLCLLFICQRAVSFSSLRDTQPTGKDAPETGQGEGIGLITFPLKKEKPLVPEDKGLN